MSRTKNTVLFVVYTILFLFSLPTLSQKVTAYRTLPDLSEALHAQFAGNFSGKPSSHNFLPVDETKRFQQLDGWITYDFFRTFDLPWAAVGWYKQGEQDL